MAEAKQKKLVMTLCKQGLRLLVLALVAWGIWRTFEQARDQFAAQPLSLSDIEPAWIGLAALLYVLGLTPCWIFWQQTLQAMGQRPQWRDSLRAFWVGHLGKYVPGKAMVVVLRTGLVRGPKVDGTVAAVSVFVETLTMMAVGALVSASILMVYARHWEYTLLALGLMICAGVPTLPPIFRRLVRMLQVRRANPDIDRAIGGLNYRLMFSGWLWIAAGWFVLGLSLWAVLRSLAGAQQVPAASLSDLPLLTACVGLAMVAGFLSLIPGGFGVRDGILWTLLAPTYGPVAAAVSVIVLRVVWLLSDVLLSGLLYFSGHASAALPGRSTQITPGPPGA